MGIREYLRSRRVPFEVLLHSPAPCATRLASTLHVPGAQVAKTVLLATEGRYFVAVLPATQRIDIGRLAGVLDAPDLRLATEDELAQVFNDCELGALPPFGTIYGMTTIVDASLSAGTEIIVEGNLRHEGVRMRYTDFEAVEAPILARFCTDPDPGRRPPQRRAG